MSIKRHAGIGGPHRSYINRLSPEENERRLKAMKDQGERDLRERRRNEEAERDRARDAHNKANEARIRAELAQQRARQERIDRAIAQAENRAYLGPGSSLDD